MGPIFRGQEFFGRLLTLHDGADRFSRNVGKDFMFFVNNQLDAQFFFIYVYFYSLHVSASHVPIIRRINCIITTSGICHSVRNYHYSLRNNPEEHSSRLLRGGSLKSRIRYPWLKCICAWLLSWTGHGGAHTSAGNFGKQNLTEKLYDYCQIFVG